MGYTRPQTRKRMQRRCWDLAAGSSGCGALASRPAAQPSACCTGRRTRWTRRSRRNRAGDKDVGGRSDRAVAGARSAGTPWPGPWRHTSSNPSCRPVRDGQHRAGMSIRRRSHNGSVSAGREDPPMLHGHHAPEITPIGMASLGGARIAFSRSDGSSGKWLYGDAACCLGPTLATRCRPVKCTGWGRLDRSPSSAATVRAVDRGSRSPTKVARSDRLTTEGSRKDAPSKLGRAISDGGLNERHAGAADVVPGARGGPACIARRRAGADMVDNRCGRVVVSRDVAVVAEMDAVRESACGFSGCASVSGGGCRRRVLSRWPLRALMRRSLPSRWRRGCARSSS